MQGTESELDHINSSGCNCIEVSLDEFERVIPIVVIATVTECAVENLHLARRGAVIAT